MAAVRYWLAVTPLDCRETRMSSGPSTATTKQSSASVARVFDQREAGPVRRRAATLLNGPPAPARRST